jgi:hypothetical protein
MHRTNMKKLFSRHVKPWPICSYYSSMHCYTQCWMERSVECDVQSALPPPPPPRISRLLVSVCRRSGLEPLQEWKISFISSGLSKVIVRLCSRYCSCYTGWSIRSITQEFIAALNVLTDLLSCAYGRTLLTVNCVTWISSIMWFLPNHKSFNQVHMQLPHRRNLRALNKDHFGLEREKISER